MTTYDIEVREVAACPTAIAAAVTTWAEFPSVWGTLLDQVYDAIRAGAVAKGGHNVMLYLDDRPSVEVGVQVGGPFTPVGNVVPSMLPSGRVATTVHHGSYHELRTAHAAVLAWCRERGHDTTGVRWEVYGDHHDDPAQLTTEVAYLLE